MIICKFVADLNWITKESGTVDNHGINWVISTDLRNLYRSNGESRTITFQTDANHDEYFELSVNLHPLSTVSTYSDFAIAEILVFNKELNGKQYKCIEKYLSNKYDIFIQEPTKCLNETKNEFQTRTRRKRTYFRG